MALQKQVFSNFSSDLWTAFVAKIKNDTGVEIPLIAAPLTEEETAAGKPPLNVSGEVVHGSFTFDYDYNPTAQILTVQCTHKPLFLKASMVLDGLKEEILDLKPLPAPTTVDGKLVAATPASGTNTSPSTLDKTGA